MGSRDTNIKFPAAGTWTFGLSNDAYESVLHQVDLDEINPKLGVQWDITERLRLRAAFFRTLKRLLAVDQTIEPTQIAGFNQFYDDPNGSRADLYGAALDTNLANNLFAGFEFFRRELVRPEFKPPSKPKFRDQVEDHYRAYFYWAPHPRWAFNAEYHRERHYGEVLNLETDSVPITLRYFHPTGFFAQAGSTFVWQEKKGRNSRSDEFVVVDAALGYRLPKRYGILSFEVRNLFDEEFRYQDRLASLCSGSDSTCTNHTQLLRNRGSAA